MSHSRLARNAVANTLGFVATVAITFFLTPVILRSLGELRYGVWTLVMSITGYYGLLDIGMRAGLVQYLTRYLAQRRMDDFSRTASTGFVLLSACGGILLFLSMLVTWQFDRFINVPASLQEEVKSSILVVGAAVSLQFPFFVFSAVLVAVERYDVSNAITIPVSILRAVVIVLLLRSGGGLVALAAASSGMTLVGYVLQGWASHRLVPEMRVSPGLFHVSSLKEFGAFGLWNSLNQLAYRVLTYSQALILGVVVSPSAAGLFSIAASLNLYFVGALTPMMQVFSPTMTRLDAQGNRDALTALYLRGSRLTLGLGLVGGVLVWFWAGSFLHLWLGKSFESPDACTTVIQVIRILLVGSLAAIAGGLAGNVVVSTGNIRAFGLAVVAEAGLNIAATVLAANSFGLPGAAMAAAAAALLVRALVIPQICHTILATSSLGAIRSIAARPVLAAAFFAGMMAIAGPWLPGCESWRAFFLQAGISGLVAFAFLVWLGMTPRERGELVSSAQRTISFLWSRRLSSPAQRAPAPASATSLNGDDDTTIVSGPHLYPE